MSVTSRNVVAAAMSCFLMLSVVVGCGEKQEIRTNADSGEVHPGHWVHDEDLREVMSSLVFDTRWPSRDQDPERTSRASRDEALKDARNLARALQHAADRIPGFVKTGSLNEADRRGFQAHAATLKDQAKRLEDYARSENIERMQRVLEEIDLTCIACHSRYRDVSGLLEPRQAQGFRLWGAPWESHREVPAQQGALVRDSQLIASDAG